MKGVAPGGNFDDRNPKREAASEALQADRRKGAVSARPGIEGHALAHENRVSGLTQSAPPKRRPDQVRHSQPAGGLCSQTC